MARRKAPADRPDPAPDRVARRAVVDSAQAAAQLRTLRDCLRYACSRFEEAGLSYGQGTDSAWDEAAWLGLWSLHLPPDSLEPFLDARLTLAERQGLLELIDRRCAERLPAAYLTGEAWLRGLRFRCDRRAIIPRSLIAEALQESLDDWLGPDAPDAVLDLCTGGGSLAIAAALRFPQARIDAADLSEQALALASENVADYALRDRVSLHRGDLFEPLAGRRYALILCNPPYVNDGSMRSLPPEFLAEPRAALAGGDDGMDLVRRILTDAPAHLRERGLLLLEIGHEAAHFEAAFPRLEFAYLPVSAGDRQLVLLSREQLSPEALANPTPRSRARTRGSAAVGRADRPARPTARKPRR
jgi:ribosomal protein L3 glutamine methyltransferase